MTLKQNGSYCLASTFYTGSLPASGTWGALVAWLLHVLFFPELFTWANAPYAVIALLAVTIVGVYTANIVEGVTGKKDDSRITIDEAAGYYLAVLFLPAGLEYSLPAFLLARFFDILKPPPAKQLESLPGGWGVMMDDLAASLYALALMHVYAYLGMGERIRDWFGG